MDLLALLKRDEGKTLEFKRDMSSPGRVMKTIVAFANTAGGTILVGVEDGTRHVLGVPEPMEVEERLASMLSDRIAPRLVPDIEIVPFRSAHVLLLQVHASSTRPHYLKVEGPEHGVYVRVGSTNRRADAALIEELRRFVRLESFDEQPMPELDSEAVDFRAASELFEPIRELKKRDLETLRLVTSHQGRKVPTIGGILLFGREREGYFPDAWIQAGRFEGGSKTTILDSAEFRSLPIHAIDEALGFIEKHSFMAAEFGRLQRSDRWNLPPLAVREALINAVVHSDYSQSGAPIRVMIFDDRLEIENPGLLPFGLTLEDVRQGISKLRNRVVGRVFHELRLIEQWGSGIQRMTQACLDAGLPAPKLEELATRFRVTIYTHPNQSPTLDPVDSKIVEAAGSQSGVSTGEAAQLVGLSTRAARTRLGRLVQVGLLREIGTGPRDPKRRYHRAA